MNLKTEKNRKKTRPVFLMLFIVLSFVLLMACGESAKTQQDTSAEGYAKLRALRVHEDSLLTKYKFLDKEKGVYRIPVARALEVMAGESAAEKGKQ